MIATQDKRIYITTVHVFCHCLWMSAKPKKTCSIDTRCLFETCFIDKLYHRNLSEDLTFLSFSSTCALCPGWQVWVIAKWRPSCSALSPLLKVSLSAYQLPDWPPVAIFIQTQLKRLLQLESRESTCVICKRMMALVSFSRLASPSRPEHCALGCKLIISRRSRHCFILPTCWSCCQDDSPELQTVSEYVTKWL